MYRIGVVRTLALVIISYSLFVIIGWVFHIDSFTRILAGGINMKFASAVCFLLTGVGLWFIDLSLRGRKEISQVVLPAITTLIFLIMATLFLSGFLQASTGIEDLFIQDISSLKTISQGIPSIPTMMNFVLFGLSCLLALFQGKNVNRTISLFSLPIGLVGVVALSGYILRLPILYYDFNILYNPMAFNTAILFIILSLGLWTTSKQKPMNET